ncbi:hypothetical protein [Sinomonas halotolerans]|uniref:Uncharacterized protein n=1 Tax=Sinomonas halotolerans TaxID=1644133 RepID=A0ABU9X5R4_9MICC
MAGAVVQCLDHTLAAEVRRRCPEATTGITLHGRALDPVGVARSAGARLISGDASFTVRQDVEALHAAGIGWMVAEELRLPGAAETPEALAASVRRLLGAGTDIIVTDDVAACRARVGGL